MIAEPIFYLEILPIKKTLKTFILNVKFGIYIKLKNDVNFGLERE